MKFLQKPVGTDPMATRQGADGRVWCMRRHVPQGQGGERAQELAASFTDWWYEGDTIVIGNVEHRGVDRPVGTRWYIVDGDLSEITGSYTGQSWSLQWIESIDCTPHPTLPEGHRHIRYCGELNEL